MAGQYKAYPEYQDSKVQWIGNVPANWQVSRFKYGIELIESGKRDAVDYSEVLSVGGEHIGTNGKLRLENLKYVSTAFYKSSQKGRVKHRDILIVKDGATIGKTAYVESVPRQKMLLNEHVYRIESSKFYYYYILSSFFQAEIWSKNTSSAQEGLNLSTINNIPAFIPSESEQKQIAHFLDHETAKIDLLIAKQQALIALLKEKRQAVISHAVTKGLNPNAKMKDSDVEWLGQVPEHWDIRTVSRASNKITNGYVGPTRDILVDSGVSYVQATHIKRGRVYFDDAYFVRKTWSDAHAKSILVKGDVLIVQTGAGTGDIGLVSDDEVGFNCHALIIVAPNKSVITGDYLSLVFQSQYGYSVLYSIRTGGMHPHLNCGEVQYVKLPIPPLDEQTEIIRFIYKQIETFDTLVNRQLEAIELMQERRTALISAAVTGKIDVRDWEPACAGGTEE